MDILNLIDLAQSVLDGVQFGAMYAILGIGFTLIFGVMHKINLSYAGASVGGAYLSLLLLKVLPSALALLMFVAGAAGGAVLGWAVYLCCFRFMPARNPLAALLATVGMLLLIDEVISHSTAGVPQPYPAMFADVMVPAGVFNLRGDLLFVFGLGCLVMIALLAILYRTRLGVATRAVSQQAVAAQLCGIDLNRVNTATFVLTGALGGIAGSLIGASIGVLSPMLSLPLTVKGLVVTVIGGLGSIPGAIVAGLLVGGVETAVQYFRGVTERDLYVMLLLFAFLVFRPGGLFAPPAGRD